MDEVAEARLPPAQARDEDSEHIESLEPLKRVAQNGRHEDLHP
jgi:hypothetical protein